MWRALSALVALSALSPAACLNFASAHRPAAAQCLRARHRPLLCAEDDSTAGRGFSVNAAAEERGRAALEKLRAEAEGSSMPKGFAAESPPAAIDPQEFEQFKSNITLGLAGFLIVAGVISLIVGGSIWEPSDEGAPAAESEPAFGFVPQTPPSSPQ